MKKPITIGVIAVIATILVTSAVDFSADAEKPNQTIYAQGDTRTIGTMKCPDGSEVPMFEPFAHFNFGELIIGQKGNFGFHSASGGQIVQSSLSGQLFNGNVSEDSYRVTGVASPDSDYLTGCGLPFDQPVTTEIVIWGECGEDGTGKINYETVKGYSGSFEGTVICI